MTDELRDVERQAALREDGEVARHVAPAVVEVPVVQHAPDERQQGAVARKVGRRRAAAIAGDDGGDALLEQRREHVGVLGLRQHPVAVRVHVDEAGRDHLAGAVDRACRAGGGEIAHRRNAAIGNRHRGEKSVAPSAVDHRAMGEDEVERHGGHRTSDG